VLEKIYTGSGSGCKVSQIGLDLDDFSLLDPDSGSAPIKLRKLDFFALPTN
jgi:hypothetical protein